MKTKLSLLGIIASLGAVVTVSAQNTAVTKPVGYHTETLLGNAFTLLGINVAGPITGAGEFDADAAQDNEADFGSMLTAGVPYTVQNLTTGASAPCSADAGDATSLVTTLAVSSGDSYEIRQDSTIGDIFGADNAAGLGEGDQGSADVVWIPQLDGSFVQIYYDEGGFFGSEGWKEVGGDGSIQTGAVIPFTSAVFIQRRQATDLDVVFVGHVRTTETTYNLIGGQFNFVNRVLPVGIALGDTGIAGAGGAIEAGVWADGDGSSADVIWCSNGAGGYDQYYYAEASFFGPAQWTKVGGDGSDQAAAELTSGFAVQKRSASSSVTVSFSSDLDL